MKKWGVKRVMVDELEAALNELEESGKTIFSVVQGANPVAAVIIFCTRIR